MATLQAHSLLSSLSSTPPASSHRRISANLQVPKLPTELSTAKLGLRGTRTVTRSTTRRVTASMVPNNQDHDNVVSISKLYAIAEAAADRAEMHDIIGEQRNNWGHLLFASVNTMTLTASIMAGISAIPDAGDAALAFKISSALLFTAMAGIMAATNKIQPSQLAEEQRNATRLFRQLERSIRNTLVRQAPNPAHVEEAMERVLALDNAYPLPLLPGMLEKFPENVEPTVWWPKLNRQQQATTRPSGDGNGWSKELEAEMKGILIVLKRKDTEQYLRVGKLVLQINRTMAHSGPMLAGLAAAGTSLIGSPILGSWPALVGVIGGVLAAVVNTLEHGGQVGMLFELLRNCAGFYRQLEEEIEANLLETEVENRENGSLFETKVALRLGRSLSEMKSMASYASDFPREDGDDDIAEFAGKLF